MHIFESMQKMYKVNANLRNSRQPCLQHCITYLVDYLEGVVSVLCHFSPLSKYKL